MGHERGERGWGKRSVLKLGTARKAIFPIEGITQSALPWVRSSGIETGAAPLRTGSPLPPSGLRWSGARAVPDPHQLER